MRIFVSEFVCGGAWGDDPLEESLAREGRAMLLAACEDFASLLGCRVGTTWDARLGPFPLDNVDAEIVRGKAEEAAAFDQLAQQCDATFVIAPEFQDLLANRCARVRELGGTHLGSSDLAIKLCAEKMNLFAHLREQGLPTITTRTWSHLDEGTPFDYPFVIKPRDGAGSMHTFLISNPRELEDIRRLYPELAPSWQGIAQPYVVGRAMSVGILITKAPQRIEVFPPAEQILSDDGRFSYRGGRIDGNRRLADKQVMLIRKVCESIPGLAGYVGIDYLVPDDAPDKIVIVEINPRLTTSYLGYRTLCRENLMRRLIDGSSREQPIGWSARAVEFTAEGPAQ